MSESSSRISESTMGQSVTWREDIAAIAGPYRPSDTREGWLARAARRARIPFRQMKSLWYGECTDPRYSVVMSVRGAADQARKEALELASRFETAAGSLNAIDPDFHQSEIIALVEQARALRSLVKPGASGD